MPTAYPIAADGTFVDTAFLNALGSRNLGVVAPASGTTASVTFTGPFPSSYNHLMVVWKARTALAAATDFLMCQVNNDTNSVHYWQEVHGTGATAVSAEGLGQNAWRVGAITGASAASGFDFGSGWLLIPNFRSTTLRHGFVGSSGEWSGTSTGNGFHGIFAGQIKLGVAAAVSILKFTGLTPANFTAPTTFTLYGLT